MLGFFITSLVASFCILDASKDLLENLDVPAAIAGQVQDVNIRTIDVDLSVLGNLSGEENNSALSTRVFIDSPGGNTTAQQVNSNELTRLAEELAEKLLARANGVAPDVYQSGDGQDFVLMRNKAYTSSEMSSMPVIDTEVDEIIAKMIELAAPGTDPNSENVNLVIVNCQEDGCDQNFLSSLNNENLSDSIKNGLAQVSLMPMSSNVSSLQNSSGAEQGDRTDCNLLFMNFGGAMSTDEAVEQLKSYLNSSNIRCVSPTCPEVVPEDRNVTINVCDTAIDGVCTFNCPEAMQVNGSQSITCQADRTWTDQPPICVPIPCQTLNMPDHMQINRDTCRSIVGTSCIFTCDDGWELIGPGSIDCQMNGQWSASAPYCRELSCPSVTIANGTNTTCPGMQQTTCSFECTPGYEMIGPSEIDCTVSGTWTANPPTCQEPVCDTLSDPVDGVVNCFGTTCIFSCNEGFHLHGTNSLVCQPGGKWSNTKPICTQVEPLCTAPPAPRNGTISNCGHNVGDTCTVSCNEPYKALGAIKLECQLGPRWSDEPAICVSADHVPDYFLADNPMEANDALLWCQNHNGRVLKITTKEKNKKVAEYLQDNYPGKMVWIGASDTRVEGMWRWSDNSPVNYNDWFESNPIPDTLDKKYDCAAMWNIQDYKWITVCCDQKLYAMCEYTG